MGSPEPPEGLSGSLLPLSLSQREVWLDQRAWPGSVHLNIGGTGFLQGELDVDCLERALQGLVDECEALRLVPQADGQQRLLAHYRAPLERIDLRASVDPDGDMMEAMRAYGQRRIAEPFALGVPGARPPWRFVLLIGGECLHGLSIQFHHTVMDGWGTSQVIQRWSEWYGALRQGRMPEPGGRPGAYRQFIADSLAYRGSPAFERDAAFWASQFAGLQEALATPLLERRHGLLTPAQLPAAHLVRQPLPRPAYLRCGERLATQGHTVATVLLAALLVYFWRCTGRPQLVVGLPSLNRSGVLNKRLPGMFVGLMALPLACQPEQRAGELLAQLGAQVGAALRHARYPLSELAQQLQLLRLGRDAIADVLLSMERQDYEVGFGEELPFRHSHQLFAGRARYALALSLCEFGAHADPELAVEASAACFEAEEATLLARRLWHLAEQLAAEPDRRLDELEILPAEERWAVVEGLHQELAHRETLPSFIDSFERQAALQPEAAALVWNEGQLSYGQLDAAAGVLAQALARRFERFERGSVRAGRLVALALPRSHQQVTALLACAKCGAAFLPLDIEAPPARLAQLLADSGAAVLLVGQATPVGLRDLHPAVLDVDGRRNLEAVPLPGAQPEQLAYVLYTSGSTGRPKGVRVSHLSLSRRLAWLAEAWAIDAGDRSAQSTQLVFDPALIELLLPLTQGASVALPPPGRQHPLRLAECVLRHGVTFCALVPTTLAGLLDGLQQQPNWRERLRLRVACCGGEVLPPELARRFLAVTGGQLYNLYGPTEATIFACAWSCADSLELPATPSLPLGRPVDDTRLYVMDERQRPLPFGVTGEICIGGAALAAGYLRRPELDAERFLPDPLQPGGRLYRSGDRGWLDTRGVLHFAGRSDRQIKLRGYRIELGDVEAACLALPGVTQAWAARVEVGGAARLHAWLAAPGLREPGAVQSVQAALRQRLPDYMVPASLSLLAELPQRVSGKIDVAALPPVPGSGDAPVMAAGSPFERELQLLWQQQLPGRPLPGLQDNFFDLGGDSLAALAVLSALEERLAKPLSLQLFSEHPSIASLAQALVREQAPPEAIRRLDGGCGDLGGRAGQDLPVLYLAASGHGDVLRFQALARALRGRMQIFMLQPPTDRRIAEIEELATLYADCVQAQGLPPGWLAGFSVGGVTALETALQLEARGLPPRGLVLLDTIMPEAVLGGTSSWRTVGWLVRKLHIQELSMNGRRLGAMFADPGLVAQVMALRGHRCRRYAGPCVLIKSSGLASWERLLFRPWRRCLDTSRLSERVVSGLHGSIFEPAHVDQLALSLGEALALPAAGAA